MSRSNVDQNFEAELLRLFGEAEFRRGNSTAAEELFSQALELCRAQGARLLELMAATSLARLLTQTGQKPRAAALLKPVRERFGAATELPAVRSADEILSGL